MSFTCWSSTLRQGWEIKWGRKDNIIFWGYLRIRAFHTVSTLLGIVGYYTPSRVHLLHVHLKSNYRWRKWPTVPSLLCQERRHWLQPAATMNWHSLKALALGDQANYQTTKWHRSLQTCTQMPSPVLHVWSLIKSRLTVNWLSGGPTPIAVLEILSFTKIC